MDQSAVYFFRGKTEGKLRKTYRSMKTATVTTLDVCCYSKKALLSAICMVSAACKPIFKYGNFEDLNISFAVFVYFVKFGAVVMTDLRNL